MKIKNIDPVEMTFDRYSHKIIEAFKEMNNGKAYFQYNNNGEKYTLHPNIVEIKQMPKEDVSSIEKKVRELTGDNDIKLR